MAEIQRGRKLVSWKQMGSPTHRNTSIQVEKPRYKGAGVQKRELVWKARIKPYSNRQVY